MAEDTEKEEKPAEKTGAKKKLLPLLLIGLLLVGLSVVGTLVALNMLSPDEPSTTEAAEEGESGEGAEGGVPAKKSAIYFPLKPPIIVNFQSRGRQRFLQAEVTLMAREDDVIAAIEIHMPMIRNSLVLLLGGQIYEELQTPEGKELLRQQALEEIQALMMNEINKPGIEQVLFTNFVMQ